MPICAYKNAEGWECSAPSQRDSIFCFLHDDRPETVEKRREAQSRGGRNAQRASQPVALPVDLSSPEGIIATQRAVMEALLAGKLDRARATGLAYILTGAIQAHRAIGFEKRLRRLEERFGLKEPEESEGA